MTERNKCGWLGIKSPLGEFLESEIGLDCFRDHAQETRRQSEAIKCPMKRKIMKTHSAYKGNPGQIRWVTVP